MNRILYRTHTEHPARGTLWEDPDTGRLYKVTRTKQRGEVGIVYGTAATTADAAADLSDALRNLGHRILDALPIRPLRRPRQ